MFGNKSLGFGNSGIIGNTIQTNVINLNTDKTIIQGTIGGTATCIMPFQGASYKKVIIYCASLNGVITYTYPTAFINTPVFTMMTFPSFITTDGITQTQFTVTCNGSGSGFIILEGY